VKKHIDTWACEWWQIVMEKLCATTSNVGKEKWEKVRQKCYGEHTRYTSLRGHIKSIAHYQQ